MGRCWCKRLLAWIGKDPRVAHHESLADHRQDENVITPAGQPFYAPYNASYPTQGRTTEIMNTVRIQGGSLIRSQTLGVSVGNPLSLWPTITTRNPQAFDTIDWAIYQARQHGLRIQMPLIDVRMETL